MQCLNHIAQLGRLVGDLAQRGFRVLVIGGSDTPAAREAVEAFRGTLDIFFDPSRTVYRSFGFTRIIGILQKSGTVVVDSNGKVRYLHRTSNPKHSLRKDELLRVVESMT